MVGQRAAIDGANIIKNDFADNAIKVIDDVLWKDHVTGKTDTEKKAWVEFLLSTVDDTIQIFGKDNYGCPAKYICNSTPWITVKRIS